MIPQENITIRQKFVSLQKEERLCSVKYRLRSL